MKPIEDQVRDLARFADQQLPWLDPLDIVASARADDHFVDSRERSEVVAAVDLDAGRRARRRRSVSLAAAAVAAAAIVAVALATLLNGDGDPGSIELTPADQTTATVAQAITTVPDTTQPGATTETTTAEVSTTLPATTLPDANVATVAPRTVSRVPVDATGSLGPGDRAGDAEFELLAPCPGFPGAFDGWLGTAAHETTPDGRLRVRRLHDTIGAGDTIVVDQFDVAGGCPNTVATWSALAPEPGPRPLTIAEGYGSIWVGDGTNVLRRIGSDGSEQATVELTTELFAVNAARGNYGFIVEDVAAGFDSVWVATPAGIVRIDPATNEVAAVVDATEGWTSDVAAGPDAVWAITQPQFVPLADDSVLEGLSDAEQYDLLFTGTTGLIRIDPATNTAGAVVPLPPSTGFGDFPHFIAGDDGVWVTSGNAVWFFGYDSGAFTVFEMEMDPQTLQTGIFGGFALFDGDLLAAAGSGGLDLSNWLFRLDGETGTATRMIGLGQVTDRLSPAVYIVVDGNTVLIPSMFDQWLRVEFDNPPPG